MVYIGYLYSGQNILIEDCTTCNVFTLLALDSVVLKSQWNILIW